jgi:hypothetical protein
MFHTYAYFVRGARHAAMCATSIESVRKADPRASFIVATDEPDRQWQIPYATICQFDPGLPIMLANLEAQCSILATRNYGEQVTFLDTDILMLEPLPQVPGATLTITWRDHVLVGDDGEKIAGIASQMPYNYGVLRAVSSYSALEAMIWMRERIRKMHEGHQKWYGNQLALFELAGPRPEDGVRVDARRIPWLLTKLGNPINIAKLPGSRWNYTPAQVGERLHGTRSILHFKGKARGLMESYAKRLELPWAVEPEREAA